MKLPTNPFPPVKLTQEQSASYEKLAEDVLNEALREYDEFNVTRSRQLDRKRWKQIKKRDDITVYCERTSSIAKASATASSSQPSSVLPRTESSGFPFVSFTNAHVGTASFVYSESENENDDDAVQSSHSEPHFHSPVSTLSTTGVSSIAEHEAVVSTTTKDRTALPKLLAVGLMPGRFDDMIFGLITPTRTHTRIKSAYMHDDVADTKVLHMIQSATPDEPLRFVGLKWVLKAHTAVIGAVVRQRDFVVVESVGLKTRADGTRIGYFVLHSVEVPGCGELSPYEIVRGQLSMVILLTQHSTGHVDVFMKSYVALNGTLPAAVSVRTTANSLVAIGLTELCGRKRKLGWEMTKRLRTHLPSGFGGGLGLGLNVRTGIEASLVPIEVQSTCSNCRKRFSRFSSPLACSFCAMRVCSKCCEQHELTLPNPAAATLRSNASSSHAKLVEAMAVNVCKSCYSDVYRHQEAADVAREEIIAGEYGNVPVGSVTRLAGERKASSSKPLTLADLEHVTASRKASTVNSAVVRTPSLTRPSSKEEEHDQQQQQQQRDTQDRDWSDSVIELSRDDFVSQRHQSSSAGSATTTVYTLLEPLHVPVYQELPRAGNGNPVNQAQAKASRSQQQQQQQPHTAYYGQAPVGYIGYQGQPVGLLPQPQMQTTNEDLYARIVKLNETAEQVYQYTKRTAETSLKPYAAPMARS